MGEKVVSEENQEPQELRKVHREVPPVKQEEVQEPSQPQVSTQQAEERLQPVEKTLNQGQESKQQAEKVSQPQVREQLVEEVRGQQEKPQQVASQLQVNEPLMEEIKPSLEKMPQVEVQNQEQARGQVENLQPAEAASSLKEEPHLEKIISQLKQKSQELEAEKHKQFAEDKLVEQQNTQIGSATSYSEESVPVILNFYKVSAIQKDENKRFVLDGYLTIGRNTGYHHWTIDGDMTVSGNHCKIYQRNQELYILDLNSTNGTYINGQRVRGEMKLSNHDKIRIGQSEYRLGL
ncbi:FHA domain-containing protein, partial [Zhenhengia yiwuensis]|uniref:FHA domain-containing protein n=1 Tax=Zhenhengia yiwuensis TaxID=2763666 RepID=UPI002A74A18B